MVPYLHSVLWSAAPILLDELVAQAQRQIRQRFPELDVIAVMRQALGCR
ncbi:hypothetical protein ACVNF4_01850 [Streptomyces sp. S6]